MILRFIASDPPVQLSTMTRLATTLAIACLASVEAAVPSGEYIRSAHWQSFFASLRGIGLLQFHTNGNG